MSDESFIRDDDDDYAVALHIERFRREHLDWSEEEIEAYLCQKEPE